jgi:hypothetical protein
VWTGFADSLFEPLKQHFFGVLQAKIMLHAVDFLPLDGDKKGGTGCKEVVVQSAAQDPKSSTGVESCN